ncbi:MAG: 16S rRNA (cytosine(1402)-N(4))-methyltransferase RsmH [Patescibacteria group bacterium]|nr:16S rRNA (cytosine(1402)-N(4))-methyltransferase RsmH [Patescibacteria group bacterium]
MMQHISVLSKEVLQYLDPKAGQNFVDCTLGLGGHAKLILHKTSPNGKLLAIEQDESGLTEAKKRLAEFGLRITYVNDNFVNLKKIIKDQDFSNIQGILFDLGLASWQLDEGRYGLSFSHDKLLDMQFTGSDINASEVVNKYHFEKLADVLYQYGDLSNSRSLAKKIIEARSKRPIMRTSELVAAIGSKNPKILAPIWQAIRIEVNNELNNLQTALNDCLEILAPGAKIAIISFHSGEDRIVKNFFKANQDKLKILTKKPIIAAFSEIKNNPRSRSAKLRAAILIRN